MKKIGPIIGRAIAITLLITILITISILKKNPDISEAFMMHFSKHWLAVASKISGVISISLTEVFYVLVAIGIIVLIVFFIIDLKKHKVVKAICKPFDISIIVLAIIASYALSCEMAYGRREMPLPYYEGDVAREEYVDIYNYFANDLNDCIAHLSFTEEGDVSNTQSIGELGKTVKEAYKIVTDPYFYPTCGSVKPMASSLIYRELQLTGITFSPFGEANINMLATNNETPVTIAHEIAHTKGVMREDEANKLAFYVCLNSEDYFLRYSAYACYFYQLESMASASYLTEEEMSHLVEVEPIFYKSRYYMYLFWKKHDLLAKVGDWFNNLYIKSSGVSEGTESYQGGTEYEYDPTTHKIIPSYYQKLFFDKYYAS